MATDNIALVRRFIEEVWNKGNLTVISEVVSDKYTGVEPVIGEVRGLEALKQQIQTFRTAFPDLRITIDDIGMAGDRVFARWTGRGSHKGMFMGLAPTNNRGEVHGISIDRITNGKITEHFESYDSLTLFQLLGAVPPVDQLLKGQMGQEQPQRRV